MLIYVMSFKFYYLTKPKMLELWNTRPDQHKTKNSNISQESFIIIKH